MENTFNRGDKVMYIPNHQMKQVKEIIYNYDYVLETYDCYLGIVSSIPADGVAFVKYINKTSKEIAHNSQLTKTENLHLVQKGDYITNLMLESSRQ